MNSNALTIKQFSVDNVTWTPITAPKACNYWTLKPGLAIKIRSDSTDSNTEESWATTDGEYGVWAGAIMSEAHAARFASGETLCYVQGASGSGTVTIRCVK